MSGVVLVETIRRHFTHAGFLIFLLVVATMGLAAGTFNKPASLWPAFVSMLAIVTGSTLIGPELSAGALQLIVSKPIRRASYVISRVTGVFVCVAAAAFVGCGAEVISRLLLGRDDVPWGALTTAFGGELVTDIVAIAILTFLGSITRAYWNAAIYLGTESLLSAAQSILGVLRVRGAVSGFLEQHPGIERTLVAIDETLFPSNPPQITAEWLLRAVLLAAVALVLACVAFERREVPYGGD